MSDTQELVQYYHEFIDDNIVAKYTSRTCVRELLDTLLANGMMLSELRQGRSGYDYRTGIVVQLSGKCFDADDADYHFQAAWRHAPTWQIPTAPFYELDSLEVEPI